MRGMTYSPLQLLARSVKCFVNDRSRYNAGPHIAHLEELLLVGLLAPLHELHAIVDKLLGRLEDL